MPSMRDRAAVIGRSGKPRLAERAQRLIEPNSVEVAYCDFDLLSPAWSLGGRPGKLAIQANRHEKRLAQGIDQPRRSPMGSHSFSRAVLTGRSGKSRSPERARPTASNEAGRKIQTRRQP
jgi:hypothetical protein